MHKNVGTEGLDDFSPILSLMSAFHFLLGPHTLTLIFSTEKVYVKHGKAVFLSVM